MHTQLVLAKQVTALSAAAAAVASPLAVAQSIERVSVSLAGGDANGESRFPSLSADGRYCAFSSVATNLVAGDTNGVRSDVFVRDRVAQTTALVSLASSGQQVAQDCTRPSVSADGRFVAFLGTALVPAHTDGCPKAYVRDLQNGTTAWATPIDDGFDYRVADLSADGRILAYARELYHWSGDYYSGVGARDLVSGAVSAVDGVRLNYGDGTSYGLPRISGDGNVVDFVRAWSYPGDYGIEIERLSLATGTTGSLGLAWYPIDVSHDGRFMLYETEWSSPQLYLRDVVSGTSVLIATGVPTSMTLPAMPGALSADGGYIAYARNYAPPHPGGAFLRERTSGATVQVDIDLNGQPLNAPIFDVALSADASTMAFATWTAGLVIGDNNGVRDVFVRDNQLAGASYCTTSTTSNGCSPAIDASGAPSASATSGYVVQVQQVEGQRAGLILYGTTAAAVPWASGSSSVLCVGAPRQRTTLSFSGGTHASCDGALAIDLLAWIAAHPGALGTPLQAGQSLYLQGYFRDPPAPKGSNLSGGWAVTLGP